MDFDLERHTCLLTVAGSRAYGIHTAESDLDVKGVAVPPASYFHGYLHRFDQADKAGHLACFVPYLSLDEQAVVARTKLEGSVYNVVKFVGLAADCNPNILDVLFCRDEEVRHATAIGRTLREHRDLFISAKAKHTFSGYAHAQLKRIRSHRAWLLDPPKEAPTRAAYGLPEHTLVPADHLVAAQAAVRKKIDGWEFDLSPLTASSSVDVENQIAAHLAEIAAGAGFASADDLRWTSAARHVGLDDNLIHAMQQERAYEAAHRHWTQYRNWVATRNADRAGLEARYGYDTKHGAHLFRLLSMADEILATGNVNVWRGGIDADEIRAIRAGAWSFDRLIEWAADRDARLSERYATGDYVIAKAPNRTAIDALCCRVVEASFR